MKPTYEQLEAQVLELSVKLANVESKCAELVAESEKQQTHSEALAVDNAVLREVVERMVNQFAMSGISPEEKSINPAKSLMFDAKSALFMPATDAYLAEVRAQGVENDVYWLQSGGVPTDDFSKAFVFVSANTEEPGVVWLPFSMADRVKRRTFNIKDFNRHIMVQGAGLVMPDWLKKQNRRQKARSGKVRWNCPCCGKISWQYNPYDFDGCRDYKCDEWRPQ